MNKLEYYIKYWCPPLWVVRAKLRIFSFAHFLFERYTLSDKANVIANQPVFIIGAGRSGTTLLRSMLVASGQIAIPPETQIIHKLPARFQVRRGLGWEGLVKSLIPEFESHKHFYLWKSNLASAYTNAMKLPKNERSLAKLIDVIYKTYAAEQFPEATFWGDQSPIHTFFLPNILSIFPNAKFVHLIRDGRDVVASLIKMNGDASLYESIYRWKESIFRVKKMRRKIKDVNYLEVKYEELVSDPETALRKVSDFIGIAYSNTMLDYWKLESTVENKVYEHHHNLQKPVFTSSIGAWKTRLTDEQQRITSHELSGLLSELGYM